MKYKFIKILLIISIITSIFFQISYSSLFSNYFPSIPPFSKIDEPNKKIIPIQNIIKLQTKSNEPNLTRVGYPIVIKISDYPKINKSLYGLNESHIRVLYYNSTYQWVEVPFQIDEKGWVKTWQDGDGKMDTYDPVLNYTHLFVSRNGTNNYEPTDPYGRDTGTQVPYALDYDDEICFYAENGKHVSPKIWWKNQDFPYRLEINITDPIDNGTSYMYIYFNNFTTYSIPNYDSYVNWDSTTLNITTQIYQKRFNINDPDIVDLVRILSPGSD
ncbi:MAG: hypothetical protein ACFFCM_08715 [Promethearchaeota archaeon]